MRLLEKYLDKPNTVLYSERGADGGIRTRTPAVASTATQGTPDSKSGAFANYATSALAVDSEGFEPSPGWMESRPVHQAEPTVSVGSGNVPREFSLPTSIRHVHKV